MDALDRIKAIQIPAKSNESTAPKIGNLKDPFEYAPKRLDGNHWEILLRPLLEGDRAQCDVWKDEVSNLLIFAGLFSAVVMAFIIESYKGPQRDPNDDMILLLSQIADRLGSRTNITSIGSFRPTGSLPAFSPTRSSIQINILWFISLVLSLTTVLVGIISLQWLREHQNYVNLTPMQQYAIFHMRRESLEKWWVRGIFTAMPLLLQFVLVLFLTGMIDFLLAFGDIAVVIPVAVVIGLTLLFLVATTLFPTLQGFYLYFNFLFSRDHRNIPVQCPYKSPQSNAVRAISLPIFTVLRILYPHLCSVSHKIRQWIFCACSCSIVLPIRNLFGIASGAGIRIQIWLNQLIDASNLRSGIDGTFINHISYVHRTWLALDLQWLAIRDGFMRRVFHRSLTPYELLSNDARLDNSLPLWDILQGLISQTHPDISPVYYAFMEVSDVTLSESNNTKNAYLHDIMAINNIYVGDICFSDFFEDIPRPLNLQLLRYQVLFTFLRLRLSRERRVSTALLHKDELQLRLIQYLYMRSCPVIRKEMQQGPLPTCLIFEDGLLDNRERLPILPQFAEITTALFTQLSIGYTSNSLINFQCATSDSIQRAMQCSSLLLSTECTNDEILRAVSSIFDIINAYLVHKILTVILPSCGRAKATLLFYVSAIFAHGTVWMRYRDVNIWAQPPTSLETLFSTINEYKSLTIDIGMSDFEIEFRMASPYDIPSTFTPDWWSSFKINPSFSSTDNAVLYNDGQPVPANIPSTGEDIVLALARAEPMHQ